MTITSIARQAMFEEERERLFADFSASGEVYQPKQMYLSALMVFGARMVDDWPEFVISLFDKYGGDFYNPSLDFLNALEQKLELPQSFV